ncbi:MAG: hypothetical protein R3B09_35715 [Nannocystaceae bacterium]
MSKESIVLELNTETNWDGISPTLLSRNAAIVTGQRRYSFTIDGAHGVIEADLGGLFASTTAKTVGVAFGTWNPANKGRVLGPAPDNAVREEFTLKPTFQFVSLQPGDRLAFKTVGDPRGQLVLSVNEQNEGDAMTWGMGHEPFELPPRFRLIRTTGAAFAPSLTNTWQPTFVYDPSTNLMVATDDGTGAIPASSLCLYPSFQGCYITIRYAGSSGDGKLHVVDSMTRKSWVAQSNLVDVEWSKVQYVSHDDSIALEATPAVVGELMVADIEVSKVAPGCRLCGRYAGGI